MLFFHWPYIFGEKAKWLRNFVGFIGFNVCMTLTIVVLELNELISFTLFEVYQIMLFMTIFIYLYLQFRDPIMGKFMILFTIIF